MSTPHPDRVVILSDFATVQGGASKLAMLQAELLAERGIPVTFFSGDAGSALKDGIEGIAVGGARLLDQGKLKAAIGGLWNADAARRLRAWMAQNDTPATIYHVHGFHQTLSPSVLAPLKTVKHRTVMHAHDYFLGCPNGAFFDFRAGQTCHRAALSMACIARNCDKRSYAQKLWRVTRQAVQNRARRRLEPDVTTVLIQESMRQRLFPAARAERVMAVPNPVDPLLNAPIAAQDNQDILFVGDIHAYKGVLLLAEAGRRAGVAVRFVGDGQDLGYLRTQYPEHRYDGWQNRKGLRAAMAQARLLVAPTLGPEPYGLAPVEALLSGVPVVMSDSMLLSQDIEACGVGKSFGAGECDALAGVLARLASDDTLIATMSQNARQSGARFSMRSEDWCDALCGIYHKILN